MSRTLIYITIALSLLILSSCQSADSAEENPLSEDMETKEYYNEDHRPQFHFSPDSMWMNDPNGMVYFDGEYHLFYQYYPDSTVWGPMHWGHAISEDLVHWEHLPIALYPDSLGYIFSGSAVVDYNNTSGFGEDGNPPLIAIFTHHNMEHEKAGRKDVQYQSIAYSNDKGRSWTKYEGNPVIPNTDNIRDFRDPKVIWDTESNQWIMVFAAGDHSKFWASKDLKSWEYLSDFGKKYGNHGGVWECPDFFPMTVEESKEIKWVLLQSINPGGPNGGSSTQYFVGDFDGKEFKLDEKFKADVMDEKAVWMDYGRDNYAGVTWSDIPKQDGRRIFMGWMSNWDYAQVVPTERWRSAMTIARNITLHETDKGYRLITQPVEEMEELRGKSLEFDEEMESPVAIESGLAEVIVTFERPANGTFGVELMNSKGENYRIGYNGTTNEFFSDRTKAGVSNFSEKFAANIHTAARFSEDETIKMHLFFDYSSAELFADDGTVVITDILFPSEVFNQMKFYSEGDKDIPVETVEIFELKRIWD